MKHVRCCSRLERRKHCDHSPRAVLVHASNDRPWSFVFRPMDDEQRTHNERHTSVRQVVLVQHAAEAAELAVRVAASAGRGISAVRRTVRGG
jgi:hypothetical protein